MQFKLTIGFLMLLVVLTMTGCGMHYMVNGTIIDAETKQPVQGAVVAVKWTHYKWTPPGLPLDRDEYGTSESVTDEKGRFKVQKYLSAEPFMAVYKEGFICWSSEKIYHPKGKTYEEKYLWRKDLQIEDDMVVELVPIMGQDFPVLEHARFVSSVRSLVDGTAFYRATAKEREFESEDRRKRMRKGK